MIPGHGPPRYGNSSCVTVRCMIGHDPVQMLRTDKYTGSYNFTETTQ